MSTEAKPTLLTIPEVAKELRCSVTTVYREIADGKLATRKIRRKKNVHRDDLDAYLRASKELLRPPSETSPAVLSPRRISLKESGMIGDDDFGYRGR